MIPDLANSAKDYLISMGEQWLQPTQLGPTHGSKGERLARLRGISSSIKRRLEGIQSLRSERKVSS